MAAVGIIIPTHNAARFLPHTIRSVCAQTFTDWICVIVDDCSSDNSRDIAGAVCSEDSRFSLLALPENRGASAARNAGLAALGEAVRYVIFLDSDDVWDASSLKILVEAMEARPLWSAVYGNCRVIDGDGKYVPNEGIEFAGCKRFDTHDGQLVQLGSAQTTFSQLLVRNPVVSPGCLLIRAAAIAKVSEKELALFDTGMKYGEDLDAWLRIGRSGSIGYVDQTVLNYRMHGSNASNKRWKMAWGVRKVRLRAIKDPNLSDQDFHHACAASRAYRKHRAGREFKNALLCLRYRHFHGAGWGFGCCIASRLDILISFMLQASRFARTFARRQMLLPGRERARAGFIR